MTGTAGGNTPPALLALFAATSSAFPFLAGWELEGL